MSYRNYSLLLGSLVLAFSSALYSAHSSEKKSSCPHASECNPCSKLCKNKCKEKTGCIRIPQRTQSAFTGAPQCKFVNQTIPSAKLFFRTLGKPHSDKPTLVFIHGLGDSSDSWLCQQREFCKEFYTVSFDLRGFGRSTKTLSVPAPGGINYTAQLFARDIHALLEKLGVTKNIIIVSHSLGGATAIQYTALFPHQVSKLVLVSAFPGLAFVPDCNCKPGCFNPFTCQNNFCWPFGLPISQFAQLVKPFADCLQAGRPEQECTRLLGEILAPVFFNESCTKKLKNARAALVNNIATEPLNILASLSSTVNVATEDLRPLLKNIKVPTLVAFGSIDAIVNPNTSRFLHENIENSVLAEFVGKGHDLFITDYKNFNKLLANFIKQCKLPDVTKVFDQGCCVCPLIKPVNFNKHLCS
jgi:pimeloyl-ACP methyl ester carboxylesterase